LKDASFPTSEKRRSIRKDKARILEKSDRKSILHDPAFALES